MNHTPGPWRVAEIDGEPGAVEIRAGTFPHYLGTVALIYDHNAKQADARLIAAAPDLLAALRGCVEALEAAAEYDAEGGAIDSMPTPALDNARTAIEKAGA